MMRHCSPRTWFPTRRYMSWPTTGSVWYAWTLGKRILGALFFGLRRGSQEEVWFEYVRALAVRKEHQRRGIGSALLWKLGEVCGGTPIIGKCNPGTEPFYVRNGFHLLPECPVAGIDRHRPPTGGAPWFTSDPDIGKDHDRQA